MAIPKNIPVKRDVTENITMLMYGPPMIGKTHAAAEWPSPLIFNTDGNIQNVTCPAITVTSWEEFVRDIVSLIEDNSECYKTIIIDLVDELHEMCRLHYLDIFEVKHESDVGFGKVYKTIDTNFIMTLNTLLSQPQFNVILISHAEAKTVTDRFRNETTIYTPMLKDKVVTKLVGKLKISGQAKWLDLEDENGELDRFRILDLTQHNSIEGNGNRLKLPDQVPLDYEGLMAEITENNK